METPSSKTTSGLISKCLEGTTETPGQRIAKEMGDLSAMVLKAMEDPSYVEAVCPGGGCPELREILMEVVECAKGQKDSAEVKACVSKKIPIIVEDHPEWGRKQQVAVAFAMCREDPKAFEKGYEFSEALHPRSGGGQFAPKGELGEARRVREAEAEREYIEEKRTRRKREEAERKEEARRRKEEAKRREAEEAEEARQERERYEEREDNGSTAASDDDEAEKAFPGQQQPEFREEQHERGPGGEFVSGAGGSGGAKAKAPPKAAPKAAPGGAWSPEKKKQMVAEEAKRVAAEAAKPKPKEPSTLEDVDPEEQKKKRKGEKPPSTAEERRFAALRGGGHAPSEEYRKRERYPSKEEKEEAAVGVDKAGEWGPEQEQAHPRGPGGEWAKKPGAGAPEGVDIEDVMGVITSEEGMPRGDLQGVLEAQALAALESGAGSIGGKVDIQSKVGRDALMRYSDRLVGVHDSFRAGEIDADGARRQVGIILSYAREAGHSIAEMAAEEARRSGKPEQYPPEAERAKEQHMQAARDIMEQLGGRQFALMTGARNFTAIPGKSDRGGLVFSIPKGRGPKGLVNRIKVEVTPADLYDVEFSRVRAGKHTVLSTFEGVYFDQLQDIFESETGLYTTLNPRKGLDEDMAALDAATRAVVAKSDWDPEKHPRRGPGEGGGQFAPAPTGPEQEGREDPAKRRKEMKDEAKEIFHAMSVSDQIIGSRRYEEAKERLPKLKAELEREVPKDAPARNSLLVSDFYAKKSDESKHFREKMWLKHRSAMCVVDAAYRNNKDVGVKDTPAMAAKEARDSLDDAAMRIRETRESQDYEDQVSSQDDARTMIMDACDRLMGVPGVDQGELDRIIMSAIPPSAKEGFPGSWEDSDFNHTEALFDEVDEIVSGLGAPAAKPEAKGAGADVKGASASDMPGLKDAPPEVRRGVLEAEEILENSAGGAKNDLSDYLDGKFRDEFFDLWDMREKIEESVNAAKKLIGSLRGHIDDDVLNRHEKKIDAIRNSIKGDYGSDAEEMYGDAEVLHDEFWGDMVRRIYGKKTDKEADDGGDDGISKEGKRPIPSPEDIRPARRSTMHESEAEGLGLKLDAQKRLLCEEDFKPVRPVRTDPNPVATGLGRLILPGWAKQGGHVAPPREVPKGRIRGDDLTEMFMPSVDKGEWGPEQEQKHPRGKGGQWASSPGGAESSEERPSARDLGGEAGPLRVARLSGKVDLPTFRDMSRWLGKKSTIQTMEAANHPPQGELVGPREIPPSGRDWRVWEEKADDAKQILEDCKGAIEMIVDEFPSAKDDKEVKEWARFFNERVPEIFSEQEENVEGFVDDPDDPKGFLAGGEYEEIVNQYKKFVGWLADYEKKVGSKPGKSAD